MGRIVLVTGGVSSGKSDFAEKYCLDLNQETVYIATSIPYDDEMKLKVRAHLDKRSGYGWKSVESHFRVYNTIKQLNPRYKLCLLDCVTMLVSNLMFIPPNILQTTEFDDLDEFFFERNKFDEVEAHADFYTEKQIIKNLKEIKYNIYREVRLLIEALKDTDQTCVMVTNEIGLGGVNPNRLTRIFAQICGEVNQMIAKEADEVYLVVSSIPVKIK